MSEKPFAPTTNRIARARRDGRLPRSPEMGAVAAFAGGVTAATFAVPRVFDAAGGALVEVARMPAPGAATSATIAVLGWALVPALCAAAGAVAASVLDGGLHVVAPGFEANRLDPGAGLRRIFSRDAVLTAVRASAAFAASLCVLAAIGREAFAGVLSRSSPAALAAFAGALAQRSCLAVLAVGVLCVLFDRWSAQRKWLDGLRMTHDELRRDARESEGDPHARGRRAALHRSIVRGTIERVREATFVVANPQHIAIALKYDPPAVPVPEILVRAGDEAALRVKALAVRHGITIVENVALARALFALGEPGSAIPRSLYEAVAQVVVALAREGALH